MKLGIIINFEDTYEIDNISEDLRRFQFTSVQKDGTPIVLNVLIDDNRNAFLPTVFNLAFGPAKEDGTIDDKIKIKHR